MVIGTVVAVVGMVVEPSIESFIAFTVDGVNVHSLSRHLLPSIARVPEVFMANDDNLRKFSKEFF